MKEGLEKHFQEGVQEPENLVDAQTQNQQEDAKEQLQQPEGLQTEQIESQEQVEEQKQEEVKEEVIEIGDTPAEQPALEVVENEETAKSFDLPEGVDKLVEFINETGGTLQDYLSLNKDYSALDESNVLREYYKQTKPHLDSEDIDYLINKRLDIDEDLDENEQRERKIALKEDLSKAKYHLESNKEKYYNELKANASTNAKDSKLHAQQAANSQHFLNESNKFFEGFEGFNFSLGEGKPTVRYKVDNVDKLKETQSDLSNVVGKFLDNDGKVEDTAAYHKALFAMQNADKLAQLFYEQGKADAIKEKATDSKNIDFSQQLAAPSSKEKLKPGQAREIESPTKPYGVNLKYTKF